MTPIRSSSLKFLTTTREVVKIGRFDRTFFSRLYQTRYLVAIQAEPPSQGSLNYALLASLYSVVTTGHFDKQKGEGESGIVRSPD
jgi:hypothetical protein